MPRTFNRAWLLFALPALLVAAIGGSVALAQGDDSPTTDPSDTSSFFQEEPTSTPDTGDDATPPTDDGAEDDGSDGDGSSTEKDCPRHGADDDTEGDGSTTGLSFRR
jgi:hypothetical protein